MKLIRFSGRPPAIDAYEAFEAEFKARYDLIQAECGLDMEKMHKALQALDAELLQKYPVQIDFKMPATKKLWKQLVAKYEAPIMLAASSEDPTQLVAVIMDMPIGG